MSDEQVRSMRNFLNMRKRSIMIYGLEKYDVLNESTPDEQTITIANVEELIRQGKVMISFEQAISLQPNRMIVKTAASEELELVNINNFPEYGLSPMVPEAFTQYPKVCSPEVLMKLEGLQANGAFGQERLRWWITTSCPWWIEEAGPILNRWWSMGAWRAEPIDCGRNVWQTLNKMINSAEDMPDNKTMRKDFPYMLVEEEQWGCLNHTVFSRCAKKMDAMALITPGMKEFLQWYSSNLNADQGMFQLMFLFFSVVLNPNPSLMMKLFKDTEVRSMNRKQMMGLLKETHVAVKRSCVIPGAAGRLSNDDICGVMYLHFMAGRGWVADQEKEIANRTGPAMPLRSMDANGVYTAEQYDDVDDKAQIKLLNAVYEGTSGRGLRTLKQYYMDRLQEAPQGSASGVKKYTKPMEVDDEWRRQLRSRINQIWGSAGHPSWLWKIAMKQSVNKDTEFRIVIGEWIVNIKAAIQSRYKPQERYRNLNSVIDLLRACNIVKSNKTLGDKVYLLEKPSNAKIKEAENQIKRNKIEALNDSWMIKHLSKTWQSMNAIKMLLRKLKPRAISVNKKIWLEELLWSEVDEYLAKEPQLIGVGFQKNEIAVARQLIAGDPMHTFISRYVLGNIDSLYRKHPWCDLGYNAHEELLRAVSRIDACREVRDTFCALALDFSDFNAKHPLHLMARDYRRMTQYINYFASNQLTTSEAVNNWRQCCEYLAVAAENCYVRLENREEPIKVTIGMFSGVQDTNGCNERRHVTEVFRAIEELQQMGVSSQILQNLLNAIFLRGDDGFLLMWSRVVSALFMGCFSASGRPMGVNKQEISCNGAEYLRKKIGSMGERGYLLRALGGTLCQPFDGVDKKDLGARLSGLMNQIGTLNRRGGNYEALEVLLEEVIERWSVLETELASGAVRSIPKQYFQIAEISGGMGSVLHPGKLTFLKQRLPPVPSMKRRADDVARSTTAVGSSNLLWQKQPPTGISQGQWEIAMNNAVALMHLQVCSGGATNDDVDRSHNMYLAEMRRWMTIIEQCKFGDELACQEWHINHRGQMTIGVQTVRWITLMDNGQRSQFNLSVDTSLDYVLQAARTHDWNFGLVVDPALTDFRLQDHEHALHSKKYKLISILKWCDDNLVPYVSTWNDVGRLNDFNFRMPRELDITLVKSLADTAVLMVLDTSHTANHALSDDWWPTPSSLTPFQSLEGVVRLARELGVDETEMLAYFVKSNKEEGQRAARSNLLRYMAAKGNGILLQLEQLKLRAPRSCEALTGSSCASVIRKAVLHTVVRSQANSASKNLQDTEKEGFCAMIAANIMISRRSKIWLATRH